ncbi:MAG: PfkB family carbohydrate kinase [Mesorhizobium sp.]
MTRILTAGVAVIDFVFAVEEMPRRAEKYRAGDAWITGGGNAGNAAVAASRLGADAALAARLGDDPVADMIIAGLEADDVDCRLVRRFPGRKSSFSSVFIDPAGERQIVNYRDMEISFGADWLETVDLGHFDAALSDTRWPQCGAVLLKAARERGVPGVLDAEAPIDLAREALRQASHIAFSAQGLRDYSGSADLSAGLCKARADTGAWVCVTDGANGVIWLDGDNERVLPAFAVEAVETLGAGDVWHAAFTLKLAQRRDEAQAIRFASAAAAIKCSRKGGRAGYPTLAEVEAFLAAAP